MLCVVTVLIEEMAFVRLEALCVAQKGVRMDDNGTNRYGRAGAGTRFREPIITMKSYEK